MLSNMTLSEETINKLHQDIFMILEESCDRLIAKSAESDQAPLDLTEVNKFTKDLLSIAAGELAKINDRLYLAAENSQRNDQVLEEIRILNHQWAELEAERRSAERTVDNKRIKYEEAKTAYNIALDELSIQKGAAARTAGVRQIDYNDTFKMKGDVIEYPGPENIKYKRTVVKRRAAND